MKKYLVLLMIAACNIFAQTAQTGPSYTVSVGSGVNSYSSPGTFGYIALAKQVAANTYSVSTVEMYGNVSKVRTGFAHDLATQGPATLFALGDAGVATNATGNVGLDFSSGGGIRVRANGIPKLNKWFTSPNVGFVTTTLIRKSALTNPDGTQGVQPTFTVGFYMKFGN